MRFWHKGDAITQMHLLSIPADTPAGKYELRLGLYNPETSQRLLLVNGYAGRSADDYVVLGAIEVTR
jgi:hypothetical protein